jgi:hypothetical protein
VCVTVCVCDFNPAGCDLQYEPNHVLPRQVCRCARMCASVQQNQRQNNQGSHSLEGGGKLVLRLSASFSPTNSNTFFINSCCVLPYLYEVMCLWSFFLFKRPSPIDCSLVLSAPYFLLQYLPVVVRPCLCLELARTIYIRCIYGIFGREIKKYTGNIRSYTVYTYGSGQPFLCFMLSAQASPMCIQPHQPELNHFRSPLS